MLAIRFFLFLLLAPIAVVVSFIAPHQHVFRARKTETVWWSDFQHAVPNDADTRSSRTSLRAKSGLEELEEIYLETTLDDDKVTNLFAWISRALAGDHKYGDLMTAIMATCAVNLPAESPLVKMNREALQQLPGEEKVVGDPLSIQQRESNSLGAMGAGQWMGQYRTRPHALLKVTNFTSVDDWKKGLPRGVKRTLKKATAQNFTVTTKPIRGGKPAPHSSLAHFRCVIEHEVRLLSSGEYDDANDFFSALSEGVSRYMGTTRMAGEIREYRNEDGRIIAFAHEVRKGRTIRGQWFYGTNEAATSYVWFHSVHELVDRAIAVDGIDVVDLGPSGSDAFSDLKSRYGFVSVTDWPAVANYLGPFWYDGEELQEDPNALETLMQAIKNLGL